MTAISARRAGISASVSVQATGGGVDMASTVHLQVDLKSRGGVQWTKRRSPSARSPAGPG